MSANRCIAGNGSRRCRLTLLLLALLPLGAATAQPSPPPLPNAEGEYQFSIPEQAASEALQAFAFQADAEIMFLSDVAVGVTTNAVHGYHRPELALHHLLRATGLTYLQTPEGVWVIAEGEVPEDPFDVAVADLDDLMAPAEIDTIPVVDVAPAADYVPRGGIEEIIVTGRKREERLQDVPIAITSFSMDELDAQKIEGGFDLLKAVPNVTFSKTNFSGYNFQIRGIGTQAISATTDPAVAVSMNNTSLIVNRLFEQEYLDMESVEVLRGPQGTLFGRNATAGVINVITAKPQMGVLDGQVRFETGSFRTQRFRGHLNFPIVGDTVAGRAAFALTKRDGFGTNLAANNQEFLDFAQAFGREVPSADLDNRDLWTGRLSLGWQPGNRFRANFIYERFNEDDNRVRTSKQLCHRDNGLTEVAGQSLEELIASAAVPGGSQRRFNNTQSQLSQGCLPGSLFDTGNPADPEDNGAFGTPNGNTIPFVRSGRTDVFRLGPLVNAAAATGCDPQQDAHFGTGGPPSGAPNLTNPCLLDPLAGGAQSQDLRTIFSPIQPRYEATANYVEFSAEFDLSDGLTLASQSVYMDNKLFSTQDFLRFETVPGIFTDSRAACTGSTDPQAVCTPSAGRPFLTNVTPGGVFDDPQLGRADRLLIQDVSQLETRQFSTELRLTSDLQGPLNFSLGTNFTRFDNTADYFVFSNLLTALAQTGTTFTGGSPAQGLNAPWCTGPGGTAVTVAEVDGIERWDCVFVQPDGLDATVANPEGHNFFLSRNPFVLHSAGLFGEIYYDIAPALKLTAGLRLNWDRKIFTPIPSQTLLMGFNTEEGFINAPNNATPPVDVRDVSDCLDLEFISRVTCTLSGNTSSGRGFPALPDIVQQWRVPTGRIGLDWKPDIGTGWLDETLLYGFYTRGYKAGGANPPLQAPPSGLFLERSQGAEAPRTFKAEFVDAFEIGVKNTLLGGGLMLNAAAFYYDYKDYQVSKIVDRSAVNENFDATVWGAELEVLFALTPDTMLNAAVGYLRTRIADGQRSLDLMDRTQGGGADFWIDQDGVRHELEYDEWIVIKPTITQASNCVAPAELVAQAIPSFSVSPERLSRFCPGGDVATGATAEQSGFDYNPFTDAPNGAAGFFAELGGNELPNAPRTTVSLGGQHTRHLPGGDWSLTARVDWYWQDKSFHHVFNTDFDRLKSWTNTNLSFWLDSERHGLRFEAYVKNLFDETPITGAFLNSDDTGLSTNVFTLDPRVVGISVTRRF